MRRVLTPFTAAMTIASLVGCSETTGPDGSERALGILQIESDAGPSLQASAPSNDAITWSRPPDEGTTYPPSVIEAPDTVEVGQTFQVTVHTIGPNGCWSPDGLDVVESARVIELTPWDRNSGADFCTLVLGFLPHAANLTLDEPGEWTLRVTGRRVRGGGGLDDTVTAERKIFVRCPFSSERPFDVVLGIGEEILVDGIFRVVFSDVSEDSRCAVDVVCVWEGNAAVVVGLTLGTGPTNPFTLNTALEPDSAEHGIYRVSLLELAPEPRSDTPIVRESYRATLRIEAVP